MARPSIFQTKNKYDYLFREVWREKPDVGMDTEGHGRSTVGLGHPDSYNRTCVTAADLTHSNETDESEVWACGKLRRNWTATGGGSFDQAFVKSDAVQADNVGDPIWLYFRRGISLWWQKMGTVTQKWRGVMWRDMKWQWKIGTQITGPVTTPDYTDIPMRGSVIFAH